MQELDGVREVELNGKLYGFIAVIVIVTVFGTPHGVPPISGFTGFQQAEARLIKSTKVFYVIVHYYRVMRENI